MLHTLFLTGDKYTLWLKMQIRAEGKFFYNMELCAINSEAHVENKSVAELNMQYEFGCYFSNDKENTGEILAEQKGKLYLLTLEIMNEDVVVKDSIFICDIFSNWDAYNHRLYSLSNDIKVVSDFRNDAESYYVIKGKQIFKNRLDVRLEFLTTIKKDNQILQVIKTNEGIDANDKSFYWTNSKEDLLYLKDDTIYIGTLDETFNLSEMKKIIQIPSPNAIGYVPGEKTNRKLVFELYERDLTSKDHLIRYLQRVEYDYIDDVLFYGERKLEKFL